MVVRISKTINDKLIEICEKGFPNEVCGILIGNKKNARYEVENFHECQNMNTERSVDRYELNPKDYIQGEKIAKDLGSSIIGIYHSHPNHPAIASETDKLYAWPEMVYMIYSIYDYKYKELISWEINEKQDIFQEMKTDIYD